MLLVPLWYLQLVRRRCTISEKADSHIPLCGYQPSLGHFLKTRTVVLVAEDGHEARKSLMVTHNYAGSDELGYEVSLSYMYYVNSIFSHLPQQRFSMVP